MSNPKETIQQRFERGEEKLPLHRLVVTEMVYHQVHGYEPTVVETRFSRRLVSSEQSYGPTRLRVGEDWSPIDLGWIGDGGEVGMIVLVNESNRGYAVNPTYDERNADRRKVVEVGYQVVDEILPLLYFSPGESQRLHPIDGRKVRIRCRSGEARVAVTVFPK